jgi:HSP20 family molecular chaperone IbpA
MSNLITSNNNYNSNQHSSNNNFEQKSFIESLNGNKIYKLQLNIADFKAEDLKINLNGFSLSISGFYESDNNISPNAVKKTKQFKRDIELPNFINLNKMRSYLIPDNGSNVLNIEAPVIQNEEQQQQLLSARSSNYEMMNPHDTNEISSGVLKYKFSLKEYRPQDISICIKDGKKLLINAVNETFDHYGKMCREFVREINLPQDVDPYKIKNCYDPVDGILRIEIPMSNLNDIYCEFNSKSDYDDGKFEKMNLNEDHLELAFDLTEYELDNVKILHQQKSRILQIFAVKKVFNNKEDCEKKVSYLLPNWVDSNNYKVYKKGIDSFKNIIVVKLPILKQFLENSGNNYEKNCV